MERHAEKDEESSCCFLLGAFLRGVDAPALHAINHDRYKEHRAALSHAMLCNVHWQIVSARLLETRETVFIIDVYEQLRFVNRFDEIDDKGAGRTQSFADEHGAYEALENILQNTGIGVPFLTLPLCIEYHVIFQSQIPGEIGQRR